MLLEASVIDSIDCGHVESRKRGNDKAEDHTNRLLRTF